MNSNVSLVILYDDNGSIDDNENTHLIKLKDVRYFGKQIKVCLWIEYTTHDSDLNLFKEFATKSKFWFKTEQDMEVDTQTNGTETKS
jgi:hypothetical protein